MINLRTVSTRSLKKSKLLVYIFGYITFLACTNNPIDGVGVNQREIVVDNYCSAHMATQIRLKQLETHRTQNWLIDEIRKKISDGNGKDFGCDFFGTNHNMKWLKSFCKILEKSRVASNDTNLGGVFGPIGPAKLGYPIAFNKTRFQLEMCIDWIERHGIKTVFEKIMQGKLYNDLENEIPENKLPESGASNKQEYWGNENSSVSSVLLTVIYRIL